MSSSEENRVNWAPPDVVITASQTQESAPRQMFISASGASYLATSRRDPGDSLVPHTIPLDAPEINIHIADRSEHDAAMRSYVENETTAQLREEEDADLREEKEALLKKAIHEQNVVAVVATDDISETEVNAMEPLLVEINQSIAADAVIASDEEKKQEAIDLKQEEEEDNLGMPLNEKLQALKDKMNADKHSES